MAVPGVKAERPIAEPDFVNACWAACVPTLRASFRAWSAANADSDLAFDLVCTICVASASKLTFAPPCRDETVGCQAGAAAAGAPTAAEVLARAAGFGACPVVSGAAPAGALGPLFLLFAAASMASMTFAVT